MGSLTLELAHIALDSYSSNGARPSWSVQPAIDARHCLCHGASTDASRGTVVLCQWGTWPASHECSGEALGGPIDWIEGIPQAYPQAHPACDNHWQPVVEEMGSLGVRHSHGGAVDLEHLVSPRLLTVGHVLGVVESEEGGLVAREAHAAP